MLKAPRRCEPLATETDSNDDDDDEYPSRLNGETSEDGRPSSEPAPVAGVQKSGLRPSTDYAAQTGIRLRAQIGREC